MMLSDYWQKTNKRMNKQKTNEQQPNQCLLKTWKYTLKSGKFEFQVIVRISTRGHCYTAKNLTHGPHYTRPGLGLAQNSLPSSAQLVSQDASKLSNKFKITLGRIRSNALFSELWRSSKNRIWEEPISIWKNLEKICHNLWESYVTDIAQKD